MKNDVLFPSKKELQVGIVLALKEMGGSGKTRDINNKIIELLNLPEEVVNLEHPDGLCTMLDYRLRWARTDLKGVIVNTKRGIWELVDKEKN